MPHSTSSSFSEIFHPHTQVEPYQLPVSRPHTPTEDLYDMLSPAEAEYAYSGDSRPSSRLALAASKADSPLDHYEDRQKRPFIAALDTAFSSPYNNTSESRMSFRGTQLEALDEHVKATVPVLVHLRTNVIVRDEFKLVTKLSSLLAQLYACTQEAIMINIDHSVCLMLGSSFDPAYFLHLSTVPVHMDRHSNGYNTNEIQRFLHRILKVPGHRGMVRFQPISEDNVGTKNTTVTNLNQRLSRPRSRRARTHSRANTMTSLTSHYNNPIIPSSASAHDVLNEQITSLSDKGGSSIRSGISSHSKQNVSPTRDGQRHSWSRQEQRAQPNGITPDPLKKKPRPQSTHSYFSSVRDYQSSGWKNSTPTALNGDRRWSDNSDSPNANTGSGDSDSDPEDLDTAEPPPIAQTRGDRNSVKKERRRSILSMFKW
ncbi:hypothetical protein K461DRAFT_60988 [Myriangium duriaei CBS 260.36]|uniref:L-dopachrome isomerase n=1 Tax=Myriangium duriaei CBS 260.36 TaxID=1168546 RepID=A0A9P4IV44_9PEZI|nr:hypothetical protein K461DRAFT_60988 [Myriangium duriaei CBS 260.36]